MLPEKTQERLFKEAIDSWNMTFGGVSGLDLAGKLNLPHAEVLKVIEKWVESGRGTFNENVELYEITIPDIGSDSPLEFTPTTTHVFFPSQESLTEHFHESGLATTNPPEYRKRLICGGHQVSLCYFSEEVLAKYLTHPDWYEVDDSSAGGHLLTNEDTTPGKHIDIRFGKGKSEDGSTFVTAILKDLSHCSESDQRHWHANEIPRPALDANDENYPKFIARTYDGSWVEFPKPIKSLQLALKRTNKSNDLFGRTENEHLRMPVENTNKAFADCCSELYKLVGPDSLKVKSLKEFLRSHRGKSDVDFLHTSGRPRSALQLLEIVEMELGIDARLTASIKAVGAHRVSADHKVLATSSGDKSYSSEFSLLCNELTGSVEALADAIQSRTAT